MEQVVDGLRRYIARWVCTAAPLIEDALAGTQTLKVRTTKRFNVGDEVLMKGPTQAETRKGLRIAEVVDQNTVTLTTPLSFDWKVDEGAVLAKAIYGRFVEGVYFGVPNNIPKFPAICVSPVSEDAEWITFDSVKNTFNVRIGVYVEASTVEGSDRFGVALAKVVRDALKNNIFPLVNDYETVALTADVQPEDRYIKVADTGPFTCGNVILVEDQYKTIEDRVARVVDDTTLELYGGSSEQFEVSDSPHVILLKRFIYNSYPRTVNYDQETKGTLLRVAEIDWFGDEEQVNTNGAGGWTDTQIK